MINGIIFDMDGTITAPYINFKALRAEIGVPSDKTIMEHINSLPPDRADLANEVLLRAEREAATHADINGGVVELVDHLHAKGIRQALVTNSHREAMEIVLERYHLHFDVALCRNDGKIKPSSDLIEQALKVLGLPPEEVVGIGDGRYDIEACRRVGIPCIYLTHGTPTLEHTPSVASLHEVLPLLSVLDRASETE